MNITLNHDKETNSRFDNQSGKSTDHLNISGGTNRQGHKSLVQTHMDVLSGGTRCILNRNLFRMVRISKEGKVKGFPDNTRKPSVKNVIE